MENPKIRFKGFTKDWEQRKLGKLGSLKNGMNFSKEAMGHGFPFINLQNIFGNNVIDVNKLELADATEKQLLEYSLLKGDVLFVRSSVKLEGVGEAALVPETLENTTYSGFIIRFRDEYGLNNDFKKYIFGTQKVRNQIMAQATNSANKNISQGVLENLTFEVPSFDEQAKIGEHFSNLDHLITLHQRKCEQTKKLKKYMLQKMFPQNGAKVPEIRFDGFTYDWEQRKFGDLADYKKGPFGSTLKKDIFVPKSDKTVKVYEQQNAINKDWHLERYFITEEYANKLSGFRVEGGDIIVSCAGTIGETYEIPRDAEPGIINQALMKIKVKESIVNKKMFNILFTNMIDDFTRVHSNGSAIKNIPPFSDLKPMEVLVPEMDEQNKISSYFSNLDHLITLHQRKCDELKKMKKYMLQNMFI